LSTISSKMRVALREDLSAKLRNIGEAIRAELHKKMSVAKMHLPAIGRLVYGSDGQGATLAEIDVDPEVASLVDGGLLARHLLSLAGNEQRSYVSLQTAFEHLAEWRDAASEAASVCRTEYELLMYLGFLGHPVEVQRRTATQMNPFAMDVTRVRAAVADTASLCCALRSDQSVVPPEGGVAVKISLFSSTLTFLAPARPSPSVPCLVKSTHP
jgi:hypothetical protein